MNDPHLTFATPATAAGPGTAAAGERCRNCGAGLEARFTYCPACGQTARPVRLSLRNVWSTMDAPAGLRHPLLRTFVELCYKPGRVAAAYVEGRRRAYAHPIAYCATGAGVSLLGIKVLNPTAVAMPAGAERTAFLAEYERVMAFLIEYMGPVTIAMLPVIAVLLRACFRKSGRSVADSLVLCAYVYGQSYLLQTLLLPASLAWKPFYYFTTIIPFALLAVSAPAFYGTRPAIVGAVVATVAHVVYLLVLFGVIAGVAWGMSVAG